MCSQNVGRGTAAILCALIDQSDDTNRHVKDLFTPGSAWSDWADETTLYMIVQVGDECWKIVYRDFLSVYDFSQWKHNHPGSKTNPESIKHFAFFGSHILEYPISHGIGRLKAGGRGFPYLGRLGDQVELKNFPETLRDERIAEIFGLTTSTTAIGTKAVVGGSPDETVWTMIALTVKD